MTKKRIWFTSDTHFFHKKILNYCADRPYSDFEDMTEKIINQWNSQVKENDLVYVLGDFTWGAKTHVLKALLAKLNGEKHLIIGNHDKLTIQKAMNIGFKSACYEKVIKIAGEKVRLSHFPYYPTLFHDLKMSIITKIRCGVWDLLRHRKCRPKNDGKWLLHGHTHSKKMYNKGKMIHIGWDVDHRLISIGEVESIIARNK